MEHLLGTAARLRAWGNRPEVCVAGLFHSIYGTQSFHVQSVPLERRAEVAALIGTEAETWAFHFCVLNRRELRQTPPADPVLAHDHTSGAERLVPGAMVTDLLEIEAANLLDQVPARSEAEGLVDYMTDVEMALGPRVSPGARAVLLRWLNPSD